MQSFDRLRMRIGGETGDRLRMRGKGLRMKVLVDEDRLEDQDAIALWLDRINCLAAARLL